MATKVTIEFVYPDGRGPEGYGHISGFWLDLREGRTGYRSAKIVNDSDITALTHCPNCGIRLRFGTCFVCGPPEGKEG